MNVDIVAWVFWIALAVVGAALLWERSRYRCPECDSWIRNAALRCRHCGAQIE